MSSSWEKNLDQHLAKLTGKIFRVLRLPDPFASSSLTSLDHDRETDSVGGCQAFLHGFHAGLLVQFVGDLELLLLRVSRRVHGFHPVHFQTCKWFIKSWMQMQWRNKYIKVECKQNEGMNSINLNANKIRIQWVWTLNANKMKKWIRYKLNKSQMETKWRNGFNEVQCKSNEGVGIMKLNGSEKKRK